MGHHGPRDSSSVSTNLTRRQRAYRKYRKSRLEDSKSKSASTVPSKRTDNESIVSSTGSTPIYTKKSKQKVPGTSTAWENIVLHYLSKLKNYWTGGGAGSGHPHKIGRETSENSFRRINAVKQPKESKLKEPMPHKYSSKNKEILEKRKSNMNHRMDNATRSNYCIPGKQKALNIVSNALEYGLANGIVSKNGHYFWIRDKIIPKRLQMNARQLRDADMAQKMFRPTKSSKKLRKLEKLRSILNEDLRGNARNRNRPDNSYKRPILDYQDTKTKKVKRIMDKLDKLGSVKRKMRHGEALRTKSSRFVCHCEPTSKRKFNLDYEDYE